MQVSVETISWRDFVIWDNRTTLHRGRRFDFDVRREMRRSTAIDAAALVAEHLAAQRAGGGGHPDLVVGA